MWQALVADGKPALWFAALSGKVIFTLRMVELKTYAELGICSHN